MAIKLSVLAGRGSGSLAEMGFKVSLWLAGGWIRTASFGLWALLIIWLLFSNVWQQLSQEVPLPAGVQEEHLLLDVRSLSQINAVRFDNMQHKVISFGAYSRAWQAPIELEL